MFAKHAAATFFAAIEMNLKQETNIHSIVNQVSGEIVNSLTFSEKNSHTAPIPDLETLVEMVQRLRAIVYPGFRSNESCRDKVTTDLKRQLAEACEILATQISLATARHFEACDDLANSEYGSVKEICEESKKPENIAARSREIASEYLLCLPAIRKSLLTDVEAAFLGDPACKNFDEVILCLSLIHISEPTRPY